MSDKTTLRRELRKVGFDFRKGRIIYQPIKECDFEYEGIVGRYTPSPGYADEDEVEAPIEIDVNHPILDHVFATDSCSPDIPRFVAEDDKKIYFPCKGYNGDSTWVGWVYKDISEYIESKGYLPYLGC